jgi:hypothetical protein
MGAIPYYSDWVSYDYMGLCSAQVAHHGLTSEFLKSANPDLILLYSNDSPTAFNPWPNQETIAAYMADSGDYVRVGAMHWKWFYVVQYLRRSTPQFDEIERSIQEVDATNSHFAYSRADLLRQKYLLSQFRY